MQHFVFARIGSETIQSALVDTSLAPEQHVSLPANSQHILPYSAIAKYVGYSGLRYFLNLRILGGRTTRSRRPTDAQCDTFMIDLLILYVLL